MSNGTLVFPKYCGEVVLPSLERLPKNEGDFYELVSLMPSPLHRSKHEYIVYKRGEWVQTNGRPEPYDCEASTATGKIFRVLLCIWLLLVGALIAACIPMVMRLPVYAAVLSLGVVGGVYLAAWVVLLRSSETYQ